MQTKPIKTLTVSLILLAVLGLVAVGASSGFLGRVIGVHAPSADNVSSSAAPHPLSPPDQSEFVDSDVVLEWEWPRGLAVGQAFAVRVWYGDQSPIETWTQETTLNAQEYIDSFSRDLGAFHWQVAVINYSSQHGFESMGSEWSPVQTLNRLRRLIPTPYPVSQQSALARLIVAKQMPSGTEVIDYVRHYIHTNSARDYQEPGKPSRSDALDAMLAYSQGEGEMPHLLCDGHATAMLTLLEHMGIESRLVSLYRDGGKVIQEHMVLEVFNPDTQHWEIQDPYLDFYYMSAGTQERASIERLVFGPLDTIVACDGVACRAREELERPDVVMGYFQVFRYGVSDTFWVNPDRFNVSKRFPDNDNANLPEYLRKDPRELTFKFDSWE